MTVTVHDLEAIHGSVHKLTSDGDVLVFEETRPADELPVDLDDDEPRGEW